LHDVDRLLFAPRALPPLRPDVAEDPSAYDAWIRRVEALPSPPPAPQRPLGLVMLVDGEPLPPVVASFQSLQRQSSSGWSLLIVVDRNWQASVTSMLAVSGVRRSSQRTRVITIESPEPLAAMFDRAVAELPESDIGLIFPGDRWAPSAVSRLAGTLQPGAVVYGDEDLVGPDDAHTAPRLKPQFSPEFLLHSWYTGRPVALSAGVISRLPPATAGTPHFEHDLMLRAAGVAEAIVHVPAVLCHRSAPTDDLTSLSTNADHVIAALAREETPGSVTPGAFRHTYRIARAVSGSPTVSAIIPFRDQPQFLRSCVESVDATCDGIDLEYLLVDNGSTQPETATLLDRLAVRPDVHITRDDRPFNWAALNNQAAGAAKGELLLFLNNDVEAIRSGWLGALAGQAMRANVAAVGARLLYPDRRLQHCGVVVGLGGAAGHLFVGLEEHLPGYLGMAALTRECAAVTGACLMTRREVFDELGGFDETLGVDLNDVDYCLRAQRVGLRVIYEASAELIHHESPSRGTAGDVRDIVAFLDRWSESLISGDPFLNPALSRLDSSCALRDPGESEWWRQWRANLTRPE
jgi:GT2 family glycosyltransferase